MLSDGAFQRSGSQESTFLSFRSDSGGSYQGYMTRLHNTCAMMWRIVPCIILLAVLCTSRFGARSNRQRSVETCLLSFLFPLFPMHDTEKY